MAGHRRSSDRWVTPGVVIVAILVGGLVVLATVAAVTYLTARGEDPDPMLRLVAQAVAAVGSLGTFLLTVTGRATVTKVERNTGQLTGAVAEALEELDAQRDAHAQAAADAQASAVPAGPETAWRPATGLPPVPGHGTAPASPGSVGQEDRKSVV